MSHSTVDKGTAKRGTESSVTKKYWQELNQHQVGATVSGAPGSGHVSSYFCFLVGERGEMRHAP